MNHRATTRAGCTLRKLLDGSLGLVTPDLRAATCTGIAASPASGRLLVHWNGCAGGDGSPAGMPGPSDVAALPSVSSATVDGNVVASFSIGTGIPDRIFADGFGP